MPDLPPGTTVNLEAHFREVRDLILKVEHVLVRGHASEESPTFLLMLAVGVLGTTTTLLYEQLRQAGILCPAE